MAESTPPIPEVDEPIEQFVARWNAWADSVPEDQNVGTGLTDTHDRLWIQLADLDERITSTQWAEYVAYRARPDNHYWVDAPLVFGELAPEVAVMRELIARPWVAHRIEESDDLENYGLESATEARAAVEWLANEARCLGFTGRGTQAAEDIHGIIDAVGLAEQSPTWINWLVGSAIRSALYDTIYAILDWDADVFTDGQLTDFQDSIIEWNNYDYSQILRVEHRINTQLIRTLFADAPDGELSAEQSRSVLKKGARVNLDSRLFFGRSVFP